ncbi:MAG: PQQ-binding-like beta-propeller repeat protein [Phycisphaerae bacterium]
MRTRMSTYSSRVVASLLLAVALLAGFATAAACAQGKPAADKPAADAKKIAELIGQLGDNDFRVRNQAQKELTEIGAPAKEELLKAMKATDMEVKQRAAVILADIARNEQAAASKAIAKALLWSSEIKTGVAGSPAITKDLVIATGADRKVYAIEIKTGKQKWSTEELGDGSTPLSDPAVGESVAMVQDLTNVYALDLTTGKLAWKAEMTAVPAAAGGAAKVAIARLPAMYGIQAAHPAVGDGMAYVCDGSKLFAFDVKTGKRVWEQETDSVLVFPAVGGGVVCYASVEGAVRGLDAQTGKQLWAEKQDAAVSNLTYADGVFLGKTQSAVIAIDAKTGKKAWGCAAPASNTGYVGMRQTSINGRIVKTYGLDPEPLLVAGGAAYLLCGQELLAVDAKSGKKQWQHKIDLKDDDGDMTARELKARMAALRSAYGMPAGACSLAISGETAYVILNGNLMGVDLKIGQPIWQYPTRTTLVGRPVLADGVLYFATGEMTNIRGVRVPMPAPVDPATGAEDKKDELPMGVHALRVKAADAK